MKRGICHPLILANEDKIRLHLERLKIKNLSSENFYDHLGNEKELKEYAKAYLGMRKADGKQVAEEEAMQKLRQPHFYAAMMVHNDLANGMSAVCGIKYQKPLPIMRSMIILIKVQSNKNHSCFLLLLYFI